MAMFEGEEMVDVNVGGRSVRVPASVAQGLQLPAQPQQQQIAPGMNAQPAEMPGFQPTGVQEQPAPQQAPAPQGGSSEYPSYQPTIGATPSYAQEQPPAVAPQPDFKVAAPTKATSSVPKPAPVPTAQQKADGALNEQQNQIEIQAAAGQDAANIEAAGQAMVGDAYARRNEELDKLYAKRAADATADQAATDAKLNEYTTLKDKIANTKVDREVHHPVLAAISLALGAIGQAMTKGDKNPALDVLWKTIDRRVEGQMADIEQMKAVAGMTKEEVANFREKASNRIAMHNMLIAGESDRAAKTVEEMVARTNSEVVRANGMNLAAQLREKGAVAVQNAAQAQLASEQRDKHHKASIGVQYAGLKQADRHHQDEMQFKREKEYLDFNKALAAERATKGDAGMKAMMEMQKDNETRGVRNVTDATPLLTPKGRAMLAEAEKLSAEAAGLKVAGAVSPQAATRAQMLEDKAAQIRGTANVQEVLRHRDPTQAGRLTDLYSTTQNMTTLVDDIKGLYDKDGRAYIKTGPGQAAMQEKQVALLMAMKNAWQLGVLSKQDTALIEKATGGDATKGWDWGNISHALGIGAGTDPEAFKARLDSIISTAQEKTVLDLNGIGYGGKKDELFKSKTALNAKDDPINQAAAKAQAGATVGEQVADEADKGTVRKISDRVHPFGSVSTSNAERQKNLDNTGSVEFAGLTEKQGDAFKEVLNAYSVGNDKSRARAEQRLLEQATSKREDLSLSTMHALRERAPAVYEKALAGVSPKVAEQLKYETETKQRASNMASARGAATDVVLQGTDLGALVKTATELGDNAALAEIGRRAAAGDPEAKKILPTVIQGRR